MWKQYFQYYLLFIFAGVRCRKWPKRVLNVGPVQLYHLRLFDGIFVLILRIILFCFRNCTIENFRPRQCRCIFYQLLQKKEQIDAKSSSCLFMLLFILENGQKRLLNLGLPLK